MSRPDLTSKLTAALRSALFLSGSVLLLTLPGIGAPKPANRVAITTEGDYRFIRSNGWPDHEPGAFPRKGNPNALAEIERTFRIPLHPVPAKEVTPTRHAFFGVALNGVPFEPGTAEFWKNDPSSGWHYEAKTGFLDLGLDEHNAHVQPDGSYHYHGLPVGHLEKLGGDGASMRQIGWAADGFPIYTARGPRDANDASSPLIRLRSSWQIKKGARPAVDSGPGGEYDGRFTEDFEFVPGSGELDEANGRQGVTPEFPQGTYYYCVTGEFPSLGRFWRGTGDPSFQKGPPGGPGGPGRPGGPRRPGFGPPPGGRPPGGPPPRPQ